MKGQQFWRQEKRRQFQTMSSRSCDLSVSWCRYWDLNSTSQLVTTMSLSPVVQPSWTVQATRLLILDSLSAVRLYLWCSTTYNVFLSLFSLYHTSVSSHHYRLVCGWFSMFKIENIISHRHLSSSYFLHLLPASFSWKLLGHCLWFQGR